MTNTNPFDFFDFTYEETKQANAKLGENKRIDRDPRICACGHPMGRHKPNLRGQIKCKPSAMYCPCEEPRPVIKAEDVRDFLRKTVGSASFHALGRGLQSAIEKGHEVEWLIEMRCDRCKEAGPISPVPVTINGIASQTATGYDALLCKVCRSIV